MAIHKHKLTSGTDHLKGGLGADLFLAPTVKVNGHLVATLSNADVLNGGKGIDTLNAALIGNSALPALSNIEHAVFSRQSHHAVKLSLDKAGQIDHLTLNKFGSDAHVIAAIGLEGLTVSNSKKIAIEVSGINSAPSVSEESLAFVNAKAISVDLDVNGVGFSALEVTLSKSSATLLGDAHAAALTIHSNGKSSNTLIVKSDDNAAIHELYLTGKSDLTLVHGFSGTFADLTIFDAIQMTGDVKARIGGTGLTSVTGSLGKDTITLLEHGGSIADPMVVELRSGNDRLDLTGLSIFDAGNVQMDGGTGTDTLLIEGFGEHLSSTVSGFENLVITNAIGVYDQGADVTSVALKGTSDDSVIGLGGAGMIHFTGTNGDENIWLQGLGGAVGEKAVVEMGNGSDTLDVSDIALDFNTQVFYGQTSTAAGNDQDYVAVGGNVTHISTLFHSFEFMTIFAGSGQYDFAGSDFETIWIGQAPATSMSLVNVAADSLVDFAVNITTLFTIDVQNAVSSHSENLNAYFAATTTVGTQSFGLFATSLSSLTLANGSGASTLFLSSLGAATDFATLEIAGSKLFTVKASNGADLFIDHVVITNTAGADISGLIDGDTAFASAGATISGGSGNDTLVGGNGADTISTGAGTNTAYGSLGTDTFDFLFNSGSNTIIYTAQNQSSAGAGADTVNNFNLFQAIDVSALVGVGSFGGSVDTLTDGLATLSTGHVVAFYDEGQQILNIDLDHDGAITTTHDIQVHLEGLSTFNSVSLIF